MKKHTPNKRRKDANSKRTFQKSLVSYILMLIFFAFLFIRVGVPSFVFFIVAIPMTISIIHKYIDTFNTDDEPIDEEEVTYMDLDEYEEEEWEEDKLDLEEFKSLRKEWKDSDFV